MTTVQDQYTDAVKQVQQAVVGAAESWTRTVQEAWDHFPATDPDEAIDRFYTTTGRLLDVQRDLVKGLLHTASAFVDSVRDETRTATGAAHPEG